VKSATRVAPFAFAPMIPFEDKKTIHSTDQHDLHNNIDGYDTMVVMI